MEIINARITNVSLTMKDVPTFYITLEGDGWGVNMGGYCIGKGYLGSDNISVESGAGLEAMLRIMDTVGVSSWEDLKGKYCRIEADGWGSTVKKIGNIINNKWFDLKEFFDSVKGENNDQS